MKLYEIDQAILDTIDQETGEILDPVRLDELQMERTTKLENVACYIKNLEAEATAYKNEKEAFAAREKTAKRKAESYKQWLAMVLNGEKMITTRAAVSFRKSESVEIPNEELFVKWASEYNDSLLTYSTPVPNKTAIKQALKSGIEVSGAALIEKQSISIK